MGQAVRGRWPWAAGLGVGSLLGVSGAWAADAAPIVAAAPPGLPTLQAAQQISAGDTAWMITATALVLLMTLPGLALFYAGMVRKKNILGTMAQVLAISALVTVIWFCVGYSLAFMPGQTPSGIVHLMVEVGEADDVGAAGVRRERRRGLAHRGCGVLDQRDQPRHGGADRTQYSHAPIGAGKARSSETQC